MRDLGHDGDLRANEPQKLMSPRGNGRGYESWSHSLPPLKFYLLIILEQGVLPMFCSVAWTRP